MADLLQHRQPTWLDDLQRIVSVYTRAFLAQSVGVIGLFWCLFDRHPWIGAILTALVLSDQAVFLRGRFSADNRSFPLQAALNVWCLAVSTLDVQLLFAILFQEVGLRGPDGVVGDPLNVMAFAVATFFRFGSDLAPVTASGRLLVDLAAFMGSGVLIAGGYMLLLTALRRAFRQDAE